MENRDASYSSPFATTRPTAEAQYLTSTRDWTPRDEAILRTYAPIRSAEALADFFKCTVDCVCEQAAKLGLELA